ncbi:MAG: sporulation protein YhbH [Chloroflexia bacterium]
MSTHTSSRGFNVGLTQQDWSLHRKGPADQARHNEKVKEAIRQNLPDIISEQSIITSDGKKIVKVPIRSLEEYKFKFGEPPQGGQVGQGEGGSQVGDVIGQAGQPGKGGQPGAGEQPGIDYYEAELTVDDLSALVFADLGLPNLEPKRAQEIESETVRFTDIRKRGAFSNLDKKRTIKENLKRNAMQGRAAFGDIKSEDLRFKTWERAIRHESNAVVLALMDVSGSMGTFEKYVSRAFYFWMVRFLRTKYENVAIRFIAHHTEAKEVTEEEFFTKGESGGTKASSAYQLALEMIDADYPHEAWNIYPFHFSDGDNWYTDNEQCLALVRQLLERSNQLGYGEIRQGGRSYGSTLMAAFEHLRDPKFQSVIIKEKADVYPALRTFFTSEGA